MKDVAAWSATHSKWLDRLCMLAMVLALAAGLGMRQPSPPDEPRFVLAAKAMVESGQWLLPHRGIELYAEKPPVFMWLQAFFYEVTGNWKIGFLLPSLLAAVLTLWLTYDMGRWLWGRRAGRYAALALFATVQFGLMAKRAQIDMVLVAMTTTALWGLLHHILRGPDVKGLLIAGFACGLGTVTKGVGFLPLLMLVPWLLIRWQVKDDRVTQPFDLRVWLLVPAFFAGVGVWLIPLGIALLVRPDPALEAYAHELLFKQTGTRYVAAWHHVQPAWYYLQVILTLWLPGCLLLPRLVPAWWRRCRRGDAWLILPLVWVVLVLVFFSISPGKREVYILPALPAICLAAGPLLPALLRVKDAQIALLVFVAGLAVAALVVACGLLLNLQWMQGKLAGRDFDASAVQALGWWLLVLGALLAAIALYCRRRKAGLGAVLTAGVLWVVYGVGLMPTLDPFSSSSNIMQKVSERIGPQGELGLIDWREQNYLQAIGSVSDFGFKQPWDVQWERARRWANAAPATRYVLVTDKAMSECVVSDAVIPVGKANRNTWLLVPGTAMKPNCFTHLSWKEPDDT